MEGLPETTGCEGDMMPCDYKKYPANWKEIRSRILNRAEDKCEKCGIPNYSYRENGAKIVLTIAHLDHDLNNNSYFNLQALCQRCHNRHDIKFRVANRKNRVVKEI